MVPLLNVAVGGDVNVFQLSILIGEVTEDNLIPLSSKVIVFRICSLIFEGYLFNLLGN